MSDDAIVHARLAFEIAGSGGYIRCDQWRNIAKELLALCDAQNLHIAASDEALRPQIDKLAEYILRYHPDEPGRLGQSEGAVETAIRIMSEQAARLANMGTYCAFCNAEFPDEAADTIEQIQKHIWTCPHHPMREVERDRDFMDCQATRYRVELERITKSTEQDKAFRIAIAWKSDVDRLLVAEEKALELERLLRGLYEENTPDGPAANAALEYINARDAELGNNAER